MGTQAETVEERSKSRAGMVSELSEMQRAESTRVSGAGEEAAQEPSEEQEQKCKAAVDQKLAEEVLADTQELEGDEQGGRWRTPTRGGSAGKGLQRPTSSWWQRSGACWGIALRAGRFGAATAAGWGRDPATQLATPSPS